MSLDIQNIEENLYIVNGISFDKQKLLQNCIFFTNFTETNITIHQPIDYLERLKKWLKYADHNHWNPDNIYISEKTLENVYKIIIDNNRNIRELEIITDLSEDDIISFLNFLDYIQCDGMLDICCLWANYKGIDVKKLKNINIAKKIVRHKVRPIYKLLDWLADKYQNKMWEGFWSNERAIEIIEKKIHQNHDINWNAISRNEKAVHILEKNLDKVNWFYLSCNKAAIPLLESNMNYISWSALSANENAIHILDANKNNIVWHMFSTNKGAMKLIRENMDKIDWPLLSCNDNAIEILENNPGQINWTFFSQNRNPKAIEIMAKNLDKVDWYNLSCNEAAISILENNLDKVDWVGLCTNNAAMKILENNKDKISWVSLSYNPSIFEFDKERFDKESLKLL